MDVLSLFRRLEPLPFGTRIFSRAVAAHAPYFESIGAHVVELGHDRVVAKMRKRRAVENHLGTVHAIAMCNMAELTGGLLTQVNVPRSMRWIPSAMSVHYEKKAKSDLVATAESRGLAFGSEGDVVVPVVVRDAASEVVFRAFITMCVRNAR